MEVNSEYIAHISNSGEIQSVAEHSLCTAQMAEGFSIDELKKIIHICGLLHDIGKYAYEFQKHISVMCINRKARSYPCFSDIYLQKFVAYLWHVRATNGVKRS